MTFWGWLWIWVVVMAAIFWLGTRIGNFLHDVDEAQRRAWDEYYKKRGKNLDG